MVAEGKAQGSFALILSRYETILLTHSHILAGYPAGSPALVVEEGFAVKQMWKR
jgi:hypothetical protein